MHLKFKSDLYNNLLNEANSKNTSIAGLIVCILNKYFNNQQGEINETTNVCKDVPQHTKYE